MRGRKFFRMGAVLFMLLALVLPVAPAAAVGDVQDESAVTATDSTVQAALVTPRGIFNECAANTANQGKTSYYLTLVSSTGVRIPSANGGAPADVKLIGVGTGNFGQVQPMAVGDLESKANPGFDRITVTKGLDANNALVDIVAQRNGVCQASDAPTSPLPNPLVVGTITAGDTAPLTNDGLINDYGTAQPVSTGVCPGGGTCIWDILITFPGHVSQRLDVRALIDGADTGTIGPNGTPFLNATQIGPTAPYAGSGCLDAGRAPLTSPGNEPGFDRGCVVSIGTITLQALTVPQAGRGSISGTVTDLNLLPLGSPANTALAGVEVVIYRQVDQDVTNDATGAIPEGQAFSILTDGATGQYFLGNLWPGRYSVTVADTRILPCVIPLTTTAALNSNCGIQPSTKIVNLFPQAFPQTAGDVLQQTVNFAVPTDIATAQSPGQDLAATPSLTGLFGYVIDGSSGGRLGNLTPGVLGFATGSASAAATANNIQITFTPTQPGTCGAGLNPAGGSAGCIGSVTATTDSNGRYQVTLVTGVRYTARLDTAALPGFTLGALPLGFQGACTATGNVVAAFPGTPFQCGVTLEGQDRFTLATNSLVGGAWNGGGTFVLVPSTATQVAGCTTAVACGALGGAVRRLEAVIPGIYRNPDTSYTGVDVETVQVRVMNGGVMRTGVEIDWYSTSSDDRASLVKADTIDLNPGAVGIFTRSIIPDGCTRCMAEIYSVDLDAPTVFPSPFLPTNTPGIAGANGIVYGLSDLQATVTHRVVDAGNALAGGNGMTTEDVFQYGQINSASAIPLVYKNYGGGVNKWSSIVSACLTRGVGAPQPVVFQFIANGETRGGPYNITRTTNPGGCIMLNLNIPDPNDPDYFDSLAGMPDGTYSVVVTSTSGTPIPTPPEVPGGFFATALSYTVSGRMATLGNGYVPLTAEGSLNGARELYAPLVFKRYNDWNSGFAIAEFRPRTGFGFGSPFAITGGGSGAGASIAIYGEDGTLMGIFLDELSRSSGARVYYLPTLPIQLPDGFRGSAIIAIGGDTTAGSRQAASVQTVNYERNQAMSYNMIGQDTAMALTPTPNAKPCTSSQSNSTDPGDPRFPLPTAFVTDPRLGGLPVLNTYTTCLTVPDAQRRFSGAPRGANATFEVGLGPTTGIRFLNPDPFKTGQPAFVTASYIDSAGLTFNQGSNTSFSLPAYHTATIFMGADTQLPDIYDGSMFVQATAPIVGIGNVVDYRVTDRDASYSFNLPNSTGRTN